MALPAALVAALVAGGQSLGQNLEGLAPSRQAKASKKRLKELERMAELEALGLTPAEREALLQPALDTARQQAKTAQEQQVALLAAQGRSPEALLGQQAITRGAAQAAEEAVQRVDLEDLKRKRELEAEMDARRALLDAVRQQRFDVVGQVFADALGAGAASKLQGILNLGGQQKEQARITPDQAFLSTLDDGWRGLYDEIPED